MKNIITDIDEVVLDLHTAYIEFLNTENIKYDHDLIFENGFYKTNDELWNRFWGSGFASRIPLLPHADKVLKRLKTAGHKIFALTAPEESGRASRMTQLNRDFPNIFNEIIISQNPKGKLISEIIARHNLDAKNTYFVDDGPQNIAAGLTVPDIKIFWIRHNINKDFPPKSPRVTTVNNILEFESAIS